MLVSLPSPFSIPYLATNFNKFAFVIFSWGVVGEGRGGDAEATNFNKFTFLIFSWGGGGEERLGLVKGGEEMRSHL
jgi:hypothetical protein